MVLKDLKTQVPRFYDAITCQHELGFDAIPFLERNGIILFVCGIFPVFLYLQDLSDLVTREERLGFNVDPILRAYILYTPLRGVQPYKLIILPVDDLEAGRKIRFLKNEFDHWYGIKMLACSPPTDSLEMPEVEAFETEKDFSFS